MAIRIDQLLTTYKRRTGGRTIASLSPDLSPLLLPTALPADGVPLDEDPEPTDTPKDTPPPSPLPSPPHSANTGDEDEEIEYIGTSPSSAVKDVVTQKALCKRHLVSAPPGQIAIGAYPFLLHVEEHTPWEFSSHNGSLILHARQCENRSLDKNGLCQPCQALLSNQKFKNVLARIEDGVNAKAPYKYRGLMDLIEIARKKDRTIDLYRLRRTNDAKKLVGREGTITLHRQVLLAMSSGKIPRLDRVLRVASDRHMSVAAILDLIRKAGCGLYHPKGFAEEEDLQTLLFLRLGGQRVAEIAHRMFGIPAPSTVRRRTMIPPLICSPSYPVAKELESNLEAAFDSLSPALVAQGKYHVIFMLDEIAQERRPRWCDRTNQMLGWCREHTSRRCMDFNSIADAELLFQDMVDEKIHLAHEVSGRTQSHGSCRMLSRAIFNRLLLAQSAFFPTIPDFIVPNHSSSLGAVRKSPQRNMQVSSRPRSAQSSCPRSFRMHGSSQLPPMVRRSEGRP